MSVDMEKIGRWRILEGNAVGVLAGIPDGSVGCCVTSPPYYMLRDYGVDGQIGREETPEEYIDRLVEVFRGVKRVMRDDGTLWVNIGDTYNSASGTPGGASQRRNKGTFGEVHSRVVRTGGLKPKDLIGIPWMLAFALRADGWYLRSDIIWEATNKMPESCTDRCSKCHEYLFMLTKSAKYRFDYEAIMERAETYKGGAHTECELFPVEQKVGDSRGVVAEGAAEHFKNMREDKGQMAHSMHKRRAMGLKDEQYEFRRKRDVWHVPTQAFAGAHFATFPEKLVEPCILAGSAKGDIVLDPFCGSGTTGVVALRHGRRFLGVEINPAYVEIAAKRIGESDAQMEFDF